MEVILDPVTGEYVTLDEQGNEVSRWNPATAFAGLSASGASGGTTRIGMDGKAVQTPAQGPAPAPEPTATGTPELAASGQVDDSPFSGGGSGYSRRSSGGGQSSAPGGWSTPPRASSTGYSAPAGSFGGDDVADDPFANVPNYRNGQRHPAAGGLPLTPGGPFAAQDDGFDNRQQVYVPGGAAAGPFETRAAPMPESRMYGGGGFSGGSGGGGGSNMGANSAIGQKLEAKVRGMASKLTGEGGSTSSSTTTDPAKAYRREGKRMDKAYEKYNEALANPDPMRVTGWSKQQGYKPGTISGVLDNPDLVLEDVFPGFRRNETTDPLTNLPMTDLALIAGGTRGRGLLSKTPVVKVPGILRKQGVKPVKPEYKRSLDPSKVANKIAAMYGQIGQGGGRVSADAALGALAGANKKGALRQGLEQQFTYDPGQAMDSITGYISSAFAGMPNNEDYLAQVERDVGGMMGDVARMKPKRASKAVNAIARQFMT